MAYTTNRDMHATSLATAGRATITDVAGTHDEDADQPQANAVGDEREPRVAEELRRLIDLYRFGVLTDAEFLREQTRLLDPG